jgi:hypothetical protein
MGLEDSFLHIETRRKMQQCYIHGKYHGLRVEFGENTWGYGQKQQIVGLPT